MGSSIDDTLAFGDADHARAAERERGVLWRGLSYDLSGGQGCALLGDRIVMGFGCVLEEAETVSVWQVVWQACHGCCSHAVNGLDIALDTLGMVVRGRLLDYHPHLAKDGGKGCVAGFAVPVEPVDSKPVCIISSGNGMEKGSSKISSRFRCSTRNFNIARFLVYSVDRLCVATRRRY
jgi:hypothetical protein